MVMVKEMKAKLDEDARRISRIRDMENSIGKISKWVTSLQLIKTN